jgi:hypothetical protein
MNVKTMFNTQYSMLNVKITQGIEYCFLNNSQTKSN